MLAGLMSPYDSDVFFASLRRIWKKNQKVFKKKSMSPKKISSNPENHILFDFTTLTVIKSLIHVLDL